MKFVKGQWYVIGNDYYEYNEVRCTVLNDNLHWFRKAGELNETPFGDPIATPASLTPDFSKAKVGDSCFWAQRSNSIIHSIISSIIYVVTGKNVLVWDFHYPKGLKFIDDDHPSLFNSFAQFTAYWAEEELKMKGDKDD